MERPTLKEAYYYGALLYAFLAPFHQQMTILVLGLWALLSLLSFESKALVKNRYLLLLPLLYALYIIGLFTAETTSFRFLETKLSFLIFPLIFFLHHYTELQRKNMLKALVYGVMLSGILCLAYATYRSLGFEDGSIVFAPNVLEGKGAIESILYGGNYYFGDFLSVFHQTVYYAMYVSVAMALVIFRPDLFSQKTRILLGLFFILLLFLISNKAAIIALGAILVIRTFTAKISIYKKWTNLLIVGLAIGAFIWINPRTRESVHKVMDGALTIDKNARYGFATRLLSWDAAISLIMEKPILGYGAGDAQGKLNEMYKQKEYAFPLKESYNAHNLWLQTWLENGLLGLLTLGILFFVLLRIGFKDNHFWGFTLTLVAVLFVNSFFESIFHRFSGISFFSFLTCYVLTISRGGEHAP